MVSTAFFKKKHEKMGQPIGALGMAGIDMAAGAVNAGLGMITGNANIKKQYHTQKKLMDYQMQKNMEMWEATGYEAQRKQMEKAGLNPARMYGMSGGGAQTANVSGSSVGMPAGPDAGAFMGMAGRNAMTEANIELAKSQARLNNVEADKKEGVDTENVKAETLVKKQQERMIKLEADMKEETYWEQVGKIIEDAQITKQELDQWVRSNHINRETQEVAIKQITANYAKTNAEIITEKAKARNLNINSELIAKEVEAFYTNLSIALGRLAYEGRAVSAAETKNTISEQSNKIDSKFKEALIELGQWEVFIGGAGKIMQYVIPKGGK
ncbi:MAG: DNA pilot protein [Malazfec virus 2]